MTLSNGERLYNLLPAIYRTRDAAQGEPLRALLAVIETELATVEADIDGLYDDWFIETAAEWVIPYIGDLLGVSPLHTVANTDLYSLRAYVANTLAYRRRKGTAAVLEQLARDVTSRPARAVEFFRRLATTQHLNHVRPENVRTPDLRNTRQLERLGTPFEQTSYTVEVRGISSRRGKYNIPNVGLFLWRLQPYFVEHSTARAIAEPADGRYTFNPVGIDSPLFNRPQTEDALTELAGEVNVPGRLRRRPLYDELEALRRALVDGQPQPKTRFFEENPVFRVFVDGAEVPFREIMICDLYEEPGGDWRRPAENRIYTRLDTAADPPAVVEVEQPIQVAVDPERGRLAFPAGIVPARVEVDYAYGFSSDVGGGPYILPDGGSPKGEPATWQVAVGQDLAPVVGQVFNTLADAIVEWKGQPAGTSGRITVQDSRSYQEDLIGDRVIDIPEGSHLVVMAAAERRPQIQGNISVRGTSGIANDSPGELVLDGLLVEGSVQVLAGNLGSLRLNHCSLVPDRGRLEVNPSTVTATQNSRLQLAVRRSIVGSISLPDTVPELFVLDSIVDGQESEAITAPGATTDIHFSTIFGTSIVRSLNAGESIFMDMVVVERRQIGCIRFSYVPEGSRTPRCHRCQPALALASIADPARQSNIRRRLIPQFTATTYGDPAYAQLSLTCAEEIRTGAEDGSEMGVFSHLKQPQREANLRTALAKYLRFGLEAGIFYVT